MNTCDKYLVAALLWKRYLVHLSSKINKTHKTILAEPKPFTSAQPDTSLHLALSSQYTYMEYMRINASTFAYCLTIKSVFIETNLSYIIIQHFWVFPPRFPLFANSLFYIFASHIKSYGHLFSTQLKRYLKHSKIYGGVRGRRGVFIVPVSWHSFNNFTIYNHFQVIIIV